MVDGGKKSFASVCAYNAHVAILYYNIPTIAAWAWDTAAFTSSRFVWYALTEDADRNACLSAAATDYYVRDGWPFTRAVGVYARREGATPGFLHGFFF